MSYVRWGSVVGVELTDQEYVGLYFNENYSGPDDVLNWCRENKTPDAELSDWYIFWHSMGGDESEKPEDQYLAMWNRTEADCPVVDYNTVKTMLETDDWSPLGYKTLTQKHVLVDCVQRWLKNVEVNK